MSSNRDDLRVITDREEGIAKREEGEQKKAEEELDGE